MSLPNYYFDLSPDQQMFFDQLLTEVESEKLQELKKLHEKFNNRLESMIKSLDEIDAVFFDME